MSCNLHEALQHLTKKKDKSNKVMAKFKTRSKESALITKTLGAFTMNVQEEVKKAGIYILQKIRNYANLKIQNGKTLPKLNIGIYSKFGQYYRYDITMYDFIHIIQFLIPIWSWISKMMLENETFFHFSFEMLLRLHSYLNLL